MRRTLGTLVIAGVLATTAACGSTSSTVATEPTTVATNPDNPAPGPVPGAHVRLVSMTGGGGRVSTQATLLDTPDHLQAFTDQFGPDAMKHNIRHAAAQAGKTGHLVFGAVVALGCDRPPGADVALDAKGDVVITPHEVASRLPECLAPVTTVAIASVPGAS